MSERAAGRPALEVSELTIGYQGRRLLPPISFSMGHWGARPDESGRTGEVASSGGELWAIVGPNGAGKSTLLRTLLGLQPALGGMFRWQRRDAIGYVPQRTTLDLSVPARVIDVVRGGLQRGWSFLNPVQPFIHGRRVRDALHEVGMSRLTRYQMSGLSEGQKQRVLMARALVSSPSVLVLDEPTSAMDASSERAVYKLLQTLRERHRLDVLLVSHHLALVAGHATHVLVLDRDTGLVAAGRLDEVASRDDVRRIVGNLLLEDPAS